MVALNKLDLTENVRYCLEKLADGTVEGKVIEFLYSIDLIDGQVKKGHHKEADMNALQTLNTLNIIPGNSPRFLGSSGPIAPISSPGSRSGG
jgi:hypothetical protein